MDQPRVVTSGSGGQHVRSCSVETRGSVDDACQPHPGEEPAVSGHRVGCLEANTAIADPLGAGDDGGVIRCNRVAIVDLDDDWRMDDERLELPGGCPPNGTLCATSDE